MKRIPTNVSRCILKYKDDNQASERLFNSQDTAEMVVEYNAKCS
jgi:hypothetical protein